MQALTLYITNRTYSSWLIRPWLVMPHFGIAFDERMTPLDAQDKVPGMQGILGTGKVPCLIAQYRSPFLNIWHGKGACRVAALRHEPAPAAGVGG